jgi:hypothetical protein
MADFCLNTLCLTYTNNIEKDKIQSLLDQVLLFLIKTWKQHKKLNQKDLRLFVDECQSQTNLFCFKEYLKSLASRGKNFSNLTTLANALRRICITIPYYDDNSIDVDSLFHICGKKVHIEFSDFQENNIIPSDSNYQPNASIFCYTKETGKNLLSLANKKFWTKEKIKFATSSQNNKIEHHEIENNCIYENNEEKIEHKFFQFKLEDECYFKKTNRIYHAESGLAGVPIYKKISDGTYWYKDRFHEESNPHFEVFDEQYKHIGEANLNGDIDYKKKDANKSIQRFFS